MPTNGRICNMALTIQHSPNAVDFAGNPIAFKVSSDYDGGTYKIVARLYVERRHGMESYVQAADNYLDPSSDNSVIFYPGKILQAYFDETHDISNNLDELVLWKKSSIEYSKKGMLGYYIEFYEYYDDSLNNKKTSDVFHALQGSLSHEDFYNHDWISDVDFVTQKKERTTWKNAQEYLYFLKSTSSSDSVYATVKVYYTDDTTHETVIDNFTADQYNMLIIPAGYQEIDIGSFEPDKTAYKYDIWIKTDSEKITDSYTFYLENKPWWGIDFLFKNRYGVFEVFHCSGKKSSSLNTEKQEGRKHLPYNYKRTDRQIVQSTRRREKEYTANTGLMTKDEAEVFEMFCHDYAFIEGENDWLPIQITSTNLRMINEDDDMHNVEFTYKLAYTA